MGKKKSITTEIFISRAQTVHKDKFDYTKSKYEGPWAKVEIVCPVHGSFWQSPMAHIYWEYGCAACSSKRKGKWGKAMSTEVYVARVREKYGDRYDYSKVVYTGARGGKIIVICKDHGDFKQLANNHLHMAAGCPKCKRSVGETVIEDYLIEQKLNYFSEHSFPTCKYKRVLFFDFYLPEYNTCIEFDGAQHFNPKTHMNGKAIEGKDFETMKLRDEIKNKYCFDNNIKLIRISYLEIKNIREILQKTLNNGTLGT